MSCNGIRIYGWMELFGWNTDIRVVDTLVTFNINVIVRNPIEKVAAFLESKHQDRYKMFNLCR